MTTWTKSGRNHHLNFCAVDPDVFLLQYNSTASLSCCSDSMYILPLHNCHQAMLINQTQGKTSEISKSAGLFAEPASGFWYGSSLMLSSSKISAKLL